MFAPITFGMYVRTLKRFIRTLYIFAPEGKGEDELIWAQGALGITRPKAAEFRVFHKTALSWDSCPLLSVSYLIVANFVG